MSDDNWEWIRDPGLSIVHLPRGGPDGWTPAALRSLRDLTAAGLTFVQVGERMRISYKTIQRHSKANPAVAAAVSEGRAARPDRHGNPNAYNRGCRCGECRAANTVRRREYKAEKRGQQPPSHGLTGYSIYGCRCDPCRAAMSASNRRQREKRNARGAA